MLLTLSGDMPDAYRPPEGVRRERLEARLLPPSLFHRLWYLANRVISIRRSIKSYQPDVVVSLIDKVNILVLFSLLGTGIPVVISERVHPAHNPIARAWKLARRLIYPLARAVTVQTAQFDQATGRDRQRRAASARFRPRGRGACRRCCSGAAIRSGDRPPFG